MYVYCTSSSEVMFRSCPLSHPALREGSHFKNLYFATVFSSFLLLLARQRVEVGGWMRRRLMDALKTQQFLPSRRTESGGEEKERGGRKFMSGKKNCCFQAL